MRRISLRRRSNELRKARALTLNAAVSGTFLQWFRSVLLATIPLDLQREGLSLSSLQASLRGRWRGNCHPGELGTALRKLGFKRERRWHDESGFKAVWRKQGGHRARCQNPSIGASSALPEAG